MTLSKWGVASGRGGGGGLVLGMTQPVGLTLAKALQVGPALGAALPVSVALGLIGAVGGQVPVALGVCVGMGMSMPVPLPMLARQPVADIRARINVPLARPAHAGAWRQQCPSPWAV